MGGAEGKSDEQIAGNLGMVFTHSFSLLNDAVHFFGQVKPFRF
jgi:hypothetical protein